MEFLIFFMALIALSIVLLYRSRARTSPEREAPNAGLPDDLRHDGAQKDLRSAWAPTRDADRFGTAGVPPQRRVERESGHGKDGGS